MKGWYGKHGAVVRSPLDDHLQIIARDERGVSREFTFTRHTPFFRGLISVLQELDEQIETCHRRSRWALNLARVKAVKGFHLLVALSKFSLAGCDATSRTPSPSILGLRPADWSALRADKCATPPSSPYGRSGEGTVVPRRRPACA